MQVTIYFFVYLGASDRQVIATYSVSNYIFFKSLFMHHNSFSLSRPHLQISSCISSSCEYCCTTKMVEAKVTCLVFFHISLPLSDPMLLSFVAIKIYFKKEKLVISKHASCSFKKQAAAIETLSSFSKKRTIG